jgi:hypothetical protein
MAPATGMAASGEKGHTILEQIEFSDDSDDDFAYEELKDEELAMDDEELETLDDIGQLLAQTKPAQSQEAPFEADISRVQQRPQVIDDFVRNFFMKNGMKRSLDIFQTEWYEMVQSGKFKDSELAVVPDDYARNQLLYDEVAMSRQELGKARMVAEKAKQTWDKLRKERDFHRMHHRRVVEEKNRLIVDLKRLKRHYEQYQPTLTELRHKYEVAMKEKMLIRLERDRFTTKIEALQKQLMQTQLDAKDEPLMIKESYATQSPKNSKQRDIPWPSEDRSNPYLGASFEPSRAHEMKRAAQFKGGHMGPVSRVAFHPKIPVIATASDDMTWKMWSMPEGQLVLSGEGHKDWVSDVAFHPRGSLVATTSGDATVKIWDVEKECCRHTLTDHTQAVWASSFHDLGDFFITCSMDQSVKAFDLQTLRCRQTFRGHVDSVNYATFQSCSNNVLTASGDKTVSLWDLRTGLCVQTFYGHSNCVNHAQFNLKGDTIASCDSDGIVKMWDVRVVSEFLQIDTGHHPANSSAFDRSGSVIAIASGDASVKIFNIEDKAFLTNFEGHDDSVQDVTFGMNDKYMVTASSDCTFCLYQ